MPIEFLFIFFTYTFGLEVTWSFDTDHRNCKLFLLFVFYHSMKNVFTHRPSSEYSCRKRNPLHPIRAASFVNANWIFIYFFYLHFWAWSNMIIWLASRDIESFVDGLEVVSYTFIYLSSLSRSFWFAGTDCWIRS
jgi:hypothetical protein